MSDYKITEINGLINDKNNDIEYGDIKKEQSVTNFNNQDNTKIPRWLIALFVLVLIINYGSIIIALSDESYETVINYFIISDNINSDTDLGSSSGSELVDDCLDKMWWGRVCQYFQHSSIGCDMISITPTKCGDHTWPVVRNQYITCESFNIIEKSTYDYCGSGWGSSQGNIDNYNIHD